MQPEQGGRLLTSAGWTHRRYDLGRSGTCIRLQLLCPIHSLHNIHTTRTQVGSWTLAVNEREIPRDQGEHGRKHFLNSALAAKLRDMARERKTASCTFSSQKLLHRDWRLPSTLAVVADISSSQCCRPKRTVFPRSIPQSIHGGKSKISPGCCRKLFRYRGRLRRRYRGVQREPSNTEGSLNSNYGPLR